MSQVVEIKSTVCSNSVEALRQSLEKAEAGEIRNVAIVSETDNGSTYTDYGYRDNVLLLGRLELVKARILAAMLVD